MTFEWLPESTLLCPSLSTFRELHKSSKITKNAHTTSGQLHQRSITLAVHYNRIYSTQYRLLEPRQTPCCCFLLPPPAWTGLIWARNRKRRLRVFPSQSPGSGFCVPCVHKHITVNLSSVLLTHSHTQEELGHRCSAVKQGIRSPLTLTWVTRCHQLVLNIFPLIINNKPLS